MAGLFLQACQGLGDGIGHVHQAATPRHASPEAVRPSIGHAIRSLQRGNPFHRKGGEEVAGARRALRDGSEGVGRGTPFHPLGISSLLDGRKLLRGGNQFNLRLPNFIHAQRPGNRARFGRGFPQKPYRRGRTHMEATPPKEVLTWPTILDKSTFQI